MGKDVGGIDSSAPYGGRNSECVWGRRGGFLEVVALDVGMEDSSVVDRKRKGLPGRGHSQGKGKETGRWVSYICLYLKMPWRARGSCPALSQAQNSLPGELKGNRGSWHEHGHRPFISSPSPEQRRRDPFRGGGVEHVTRDLKTM